MNDAVSPVSDGKQGAADEVTREATTVVAPAKPSEPPRHVLIAFYVVAAALLGGALVIGYLTSPPPKPKDASASASASASTEAAPPPSKPVGRRRRPHAGHDN